MSGVARGIATALAYVAVLAFVVAGLSLVTSDDGHAARRAHGHHRVRADLASLRLSTTQTRFPVAPRDSHPQQGNDGEVVRPTRVTAVFASPGRRPFAKVGPHQIGETWLPVVDRRGAWSQVLLPSRPNGSVGWLRTSQVEQRRSPYLIRVHLGSRRLELLHEGNSLGSWPVAVGKPDTPTPSGRTFLLGSLTDPNQSFSPVILPLGAHSDTLDTYGGGPGTVAIHGWPDTSVFGTAVSHGCIRVPAEALDRLTQVPLGTLVIIDQQ